MNSSVVEDLIEVTTEDIINKIYEIVVADRQVKFKEIDGIVNISI